MVFHFLFPHLILWHLDMLNRERRNHNAGSQSQLRKKGEYFTDVISQQGRSSLRPDSTFIPERPFIVCSYLIHQSVSALNEIPTIPLHSTSKTMSFTIRTVSGGGCFLPRGCFLPGGCLLPSMHWGRLPPVNRITDTSKNIALATTSLRPVTWTKAAPYIHGFLFWRVVHSQRATQTARCNRTHCKWSQVYISTCIDWLRHNTVNP